MDYMKLVKFYRDHCIPGSGLSDEALCAYFIALDHRKNLIVEYDFEFEITGFTEFWRINYEQLGKILVHGMIDAREEDTSSGDIAFVANVAIRPDCSRDIFKAMKARFFLTNYTCKFFCGDSRRRVHHHTFNIYPRTEMISKYLPTKEPIYG